MANEQPKPTPPPTPTHPIVEPDSERPTTPDRSPGIDLDTQRIGRLWAFDRQRTRFRKAS